jgi:hypothetical protein
LTHKHWLFSVADNPIEIRFPPSTSQDFIVVAEVSSVKAGLGRVVPIEVSTGELGGIYVLEHSHYRTLFCIPYAKLDAFYCGFGFRPVSADTAVSDVVSEKMNWCAKQYSDPVSLLVRAAR